MKKIAINASFLVLTLSLAACSTKPTRSTASTGDVTINAKSVSGSSPLEKIKAIKSCIYGVSSNGDSVRVGLNAPGVISANIMVDIPASMLPLQNGASFTDARGNDISYANGVLSSQRIRVDDTFGGKEIKTMSIQVGPDLQNVQSGSTKSVYKKFLSQELQAEMSCQF